MRKFLIAALAGLTLTAAPAAAQHWRYYPRQRYYPPQYAPNYAPSYAPSYTPSYVPSPADPATQTVRNWYLQYLHREPDPGMQGFVDSLRQGQSPLWVEAEIAGSQEGYNKAGGTPEGFVQMMYQAVAGRPPSPDELRHWISLTSANGPIQVAYDLLRTFRPNPAWGG